MIPIPKRGLALIIILIAILLLMGGCFTGVIEFDYTDLSWNDNGDGGGSPGGPTVIGPPEEEEDDPHDGMTEIVVFTVSETDRLGPWDSLTAAYTIDDYTDPTLVVERSLIIPDGFCVFWGGDPYYEWDLYDSAGTHFWSKDDYVEVNTYGSGDMISGFNDDGQLEMVMENHFGFTVTYSYRLTIYAYV